MDVGSALLHGVRHDRVDKLDDGSLVDERAGVVGGRFVLALENLDVIDDVREQVLHLRFARFVELLDGVAERELTGDDREDVQTRDELYVLQHAQMSGISQGNRQRSAVTFEGQHGVLEGKVARNELGDARIDLELGEVDGGHAVLARQHPGEVGFLDETELDEVVADTCTVVFLLLESLVQLVLGDQPFSQKQIANPRRICGRSCQERVSLR
jgi:hypothetical protein